MTDEQARKKLFVSGALTTLLREATGRYVLHLHYHVDGHDEIVTVTYASMTQQDVNVSCDSEWAIAKDVMSAVADRFE